MNLYRVYGNLKFNMYDPENQCDVTGSKQIMRVDSEVQAVSEQDAMRLVWLQEESKLAATEHEYDSPSWNPIPIIEYLGIIPEVIPESTQFDLFSLL